MFVFFTALWLGLDSPIVCCRSCCYFIPTWSYCLNSNGLLSRVLSAQRQRCRPWLADEILLQLDKTEVFTIHLQRIGRKHQPFRDQGGMQQTLCAVTRSRTMGQLPEDQGRCLMWRLPLTIINIYEIERMFCICVIFYDMKGI